ncbi:histone H2B 1/2-like [Styela clava]|uniref:histone H2B-like n=1 Tax=Styela clava TaxID=7725 RepID=UPI00193963B7|nr:histone H2B-like [Styela clava]
MDKKRGKRAIEFVKSMPPSKRAKMSPSQKCPQKSSGGSAGRAKKAEEECFRNNMYKVLKEIYDDTGITKQAMNIMNSLVNELFIAIATEAKRIMESGNRTTMTARDIQNAVKSILPGELEKHAVSEGTKAVAKFKSYTFS